MRESNLDPAFQSVTGMGELQKIYKQNRIATFSEIFSSLFMMFLSVIAIYYVWSQFKITQAITLEMTLIFLSAPFFMILGVSPLMKIYSRRNDCAVVYRHGFAYLHNDEIKSFRWDNITSVTARATDVRALGILSVGKVREYWIVNRSSELRLASTLDQIDDLLAEIRKHTLNVTNIK
jgi:hypothetical protein